MNDTPSLADGGELRVELPPNARLSAIEFFDDAREMRALFADGSERTIAVGLVTSLHGARIRSERVGPAAETSVLIGFFWPGFLRRTVGARPEAAIEELHFALAVRAAGVEELWYLLADTFNFRKTLRPDAGYSTEINLRVLVRRLAAFAPQATQDGFFAAMLGDLPLPPPVNTLIEFFRTVGKDLP